MPRKGTVGRREVPPDSVYQSTLVQRFINCLMEDGKKSVANRILYGAFEIMQQKANEDPLNLFKKAVDNAKPVLEVKTRRVGGANYQIPSEVNQSRRTSLSIRWLLSYARNRGEKSMKEKLAGELLEASNHRGGAVKKKDDTHRMAEANKAFAHYRW